MDTESDAPRLHSRTYTRFVTVLKFLLPATAIAVIAMVVLWSHLRPSVDRFRIGSTVLRETVDEEHAMIHARYVGVDRKGQPFSITAQTVSFLDQDGNMMQLDTPQADITLADGAWVALTADSGLYDRDGGSLGLTGAVSVFHDGGYEVRTTEATIDLNAGTAAGSRPVEVQGPFGELSAAGFHLGDDGGTIFFGGPAVMHVSPNALSTQP